MQTKNYIDGCTHTNVAHASRVCLGCGIVVGDQYTAVVEIIRDARIEERSAAQADLLVELAAVEQHKPDVHARIRELCAALTAECRRKHSGCASNWTLYKPDLVRPSTKYLRITEYDAITLHTRDLDPNDVARLPPSEIDPMGYRYVGPSNEGRSVWAFVELSNGLVWKAATFKKPALNFPRGCVFDAESLAYLATQLNGLTNGAYHAELR